MISKFRDSHKEEEEAIWIGVDLWRDKTSKEEEATDNLNISKDMISKNL